MSDEAAIRYPAVAGQFYERNSNRLRNQLDQCFLHDLGPGKLPETPLDDDEGRILGAMCPHAGYVYSGPPAAKAYFQLARQPRPDTVVVLCPNHSGWGEPVSVWPDGAWETPLGRLAVDEALNEAVLARCSHARADRRAHLGEHSAEVQLPFLQYTYFEPPKIAVICLGTHQREALRSLAEALAEVTAEGHYLLLASTDMTHFQSKRDAERLDKMALDKVAAIDAEGLLDVVQANDISMCGVAPTAVMLAACKLRGAESVELLAYSTSGDITGDNARVVGYAAAVVRAAN
jgi:AmmeMemoRadiSam system protein B